ncbi:hypothetical protein V6N13_114019 [Hibiscus sabdariffa]
MLPAASTSQRGMRGSGSQRSLTSGLLYSGDHPVLTFIATTSARGSFSTTTPGWCTACISVGTHVALLFLWCSALSFMICLIHLCGYDPYKTPRGLSQCLACWCIVLSISSCLLTCTFQIACWWPSSSSLGRNALALLGALSSLAPEPCSRSMDETRGWQVVAGPFSHLPGSVCSCSSNETQGWQTVVVPFSRFPGRVCGPSLDPPSLAVAMGASLLEPLFVACWRSPSGFILRPSCWAGPIGVLFSLSISLTLCEAPILPLPINLNFLLLYKSRDHSPSRHHCDSLSLLSFPCVLRSSPSFSTMADALLTQLGDLCSTVEEQEVVVVASNSMEVPAEDFACSLVDKPKRPTAARPRSRVTVIEDDDSTPISSAASDSNAASRTTPVEPAPTSVAASTRTTKAPPVPTTTSTPPNAPLGEHEAYDPMVHVDMSNMLEDSLDILGDCPLSADLDDVIPSAGDDLANVAIDEAADSLIHEVASSILGELPRSVTTASAVSVAALVASLIAPALA